VAAQTILQCNGETMEFMMIPPKGREKEEAGYLLIRCRPATKDDELAMKKKHKQNLFATTTEDATRAAWPHSLPDPVPKSQQENKQTADKTKSSAALETATPATGATTTQKAAEDYVASSERETAAAAAAVATPKPDEDLCLSIEIVSCRGLIIGDKVSSDPYVKVKMGRKDLHETKHILKT
jgi:hypothetical protein